MIPALKRFATERASGTWLPRKRVWKLLEKPKVEEVEDSEVPPPPKRA